jgi:hypothetical protein
VYKYRCSRGGHIFKSSARGASVIIVPCIGIIFPMTYKLYLITLASIGVGRLISMRGVKINCLQGIQNMSRKYNDF